MTRNEIARQQIACTKLLRTPQLTRRVQFGIHSASQVPLFSITKHCSTYIVDLQTSEPKLSLLKRQPSMASSHTPTFAILQCTKNGLESGLSDFFLVRLVNLRTKFTQCLFGLAKCAIYI